MINYFDLCPELKSLIRHLILYFIYSFIVTTLIVNYTTKTWNYSRQIVYDWQKPTVQNDGLTNQAKQ